MPSPVIRALSSMLVAYGLTLATWSTAGEPALRLSNSHLDFGSVQVPNASAWRELSLANTAASSVSLSRLEVTEGFEARTDCSIELPPAYSCKLEFRFIPSGATLNYLGHATVYASDGQQYRIGLTGTQADLRAEISRARFDFGVMEVYGKESRQPFSIRNAGDGDLSLYGFSLAEPNDPSIRIRPGTCAPLPKTLLPGESCDSELEVSPKKSGELANTLLVATNELRSHIRIPVTAQGRQASISLPGRLVDFGYTSLGGVSSATAVTLTNDGEAPLKVRSVSRVGEQAPSFMVSNSCGNPVPVGGSCQLSLQASPVEEGAQQAEIEVVSNASGSPHLLGVKTYALSMEVLSADGQVVLADLGLPGVSLNIPYPGAKKFIISNLAKRSQTAGFSYKANGLLEFSSEGRAAGCTWKEPGAVLEISGNSHCLITTTAYRTTPEPWSGAFTLSLGGFDKTLPIHGAVRQANPELLPGTALDWGVVAISSPDADLQRNIIVANRGAGDLALSAINLVDATGKPSPDFLLMDSTCNSGLVHAGSACSLTVAPALKAEGAKTALLQLETSVGPLQVSLAVSGAQAQVTWLDTETGKVVADLVLGVGSKGQNNSKKVWFRNTGLAPISSLKPRPNPAFSLTLGPDCPGSLAPGDQCLVSVAPILDSSAKPVALNGQVVLTHGKAGAHEFSIPVSISNQAAQK
jgi:hypothetical protein